MIEILCCAALWLAPIAAFAASGGAYEVQTQAFGSGVRAEGGAYTMVGILGTPDLPDLVGGIYTLDGGLSFAGGGAVVGIRPDLPTQIFFRGPSPNPSSGNAAFRLELPDAMRVRGTVYSLDGRLVRSLVDRTLPAGAHDLVWNRNDNAGGRVAAGVYLVRVEVGSTAMTRRIVLLAQ